MLASRFSARRCWVGVDIDPAHLYRASHVATITLAARPSLSYSPASRDRSLILSGTPPPRLSTSKELAGDAGLKALALVFWQNAGPSTTFRRNETFRSNSSFVEVFGNLFRSSSAVHNQGGKTRNNSRRTRHLVLVGASGPAPGHCHVRRGVIRLFDLRDPMGSLIGFPLEIRVVARQSHTKSEWIRQQCVLPAVRIAQIVGWSVRVGGRYVLYPRPACRVTGRPLIRNRSPEGRTIQTGIGLKNASRCPKSSRRRDNSSARGPRPDRASSARSLCSSWPWCHKPGFT